MTQEQAKRILNPSTRIEALMEIEYYAGFNSEKVNNAMNEACVIGATAITELQRVNKVLNEIKNLVYDVNQAEIGSHIAHRDLDDWIDNWSHSILTYIKSIQNNNKR